MDVQTWTFIIVGLTFAMYIGIAIWARAGSTKEFYIAGGNCSRLDECSFFYFNGGIDFFYGV